MTRTRTRSTRSAVTATKPDYEDKARAPSQTLRAPTRKSTRKEYEYDSDALDDDDFPAPKPGGMEEGEGGDEYEEPEDVDAEEDAEEEKEVKKKATPKKKKAGAQRKGASPSKNRKRKKQMDEDEEEDGEEEEEVSSPKRKRARRKASKAEEAAEEDDDDSDDDLQEGQVVVGRVVKAPTTGRVPPGQISQNTLDFLTKLKDSACNDREWFKLHEPVYRVAEKEWKDFVEAFTDILVEVDPEVPPLPTKDVIHRIYRDVRFSNDKTPYKRNLSATLSRGGRKGVFAKYHICVKPGGESLIAAGLWCPGKNELDNVRTNLQRNSQPFRDLISSPTYVKLFGKAEPRKDGKTQNIFGREDELKVAPKGIPKDHKDIDILKCRSFALVHHFTDKQVLDPHFKDELGRLARALRPFVYILNDLLTVGGSTTSLERYQVEVDDVE